MPPSRATSNKQGIYDSTVMVQPMITSLFGPGRATAASKNGTTTRRSSLRVEKKKDVGKGTARKRKAMSLGGDEEDPDSTLVEVNASALKSLSMQQRTLTTPLPIAKRAKISHNAQDSENSPAGNSTLVVTPDSCRDKVASEGCQNGKKDEEVLKPLRPWLEMQKAWEGQRLVSGSFTPPSETMTQASLNSFGFSVDRRTAYSQVDGPPRKHVFSVAFEDEEDLEFDSSVPSSQTAAVPQKTKNASPAKSTISSSRSPSPALLSPVKSTPLRERVNDSSPISRLEFYLPPLTIIPSSQTQQFPPLSPASIRTGIIPSSQTQQFSVLSPPSSRSSSFLIPSSQTQVITPLSPSSQRSQADRIEASPRTISRTMLLSSQAIENIKPLSACSLPALPTLIRNATETSDEPHTTNPLAPKPKDDTQSVRRQRTSSTSYYGDSVAFTMPPSLPGTSLGTSGSSSEPSSDDGPSLFDSSIAQKLFRTVESASSTVEALPSELNEIADDNLLPNATSSGTAGHRPAVLHNDAAAPTAATTSTRSLDNGTIAFTMPPSIPTGTLAVNLADYLPLLDP